MLITRCVPDRLHRRKRRRQIPLSLGLSFGQVFTKDRVAFSAAVEFKPKKRKKGRYRRKKG